MRRIKNWNVFIRESISNLGLSKAQLEDFFIELQDDGITSLLDVNSPSEQANKLSKSGFVFFPLTWDREALKRLYYAMISILEFPDAVDYDLRDFFLDPLSENIKTLSERLVYVIPSELFPWDSDLKSDLTEKSFIELFSECVSRGFIKAFHTTFIRLTPFEAEDFELVIEKLELLYRATDYRPLSGSLWLEDYVNHTGDDVYTEVHSDICLVKCSDQEYNILNSIRDKILLGGGSGDINKQMTAHFI